MARAESAKPGAKNPPRAPPRTRCPPTPRRHGATSSAGSPRSDGRDPVGNSTSPRTRSGRDSAYARAIPPPIECPINITRRSTSSSSASDRRRTHPAGRIASGASEPSRESTARQCARARAATRVRGGRSDRRRCPAVQHDHVDVARSLSSTRTRVCERHKTNGMFSWPARKISAGDSGRVTRARRSQRAGRSGRSRKSRRSNARRRRDDLRADRAARVSSSCAARHAFVRMPAPCSSRSQRNRS